MDHQQELVDTLPADLRHHAELRQVGSDGVGEHGSLPHLHQPHPVQHQNALLLARLRLDKAHGGAGHGLADRLGISHVVLLPLHIRFDVSRRHELHLMTQALQLT